MTHIPHLTRRALAAGLATSWVLGAVPGAIAAAATPQPASAMDALADAYMDAYNALFPVDATENNGDPRYEDKLEVEIAPAHIARQRRTYEGFLAKLRAIDRAKLGADDAYTHELLEYELNDKLANMTIPWHLMPVGHMDCLPVRLSNWASGTSAQPMKTVANYDRFLARLRRLPLWIDQAMANMQQGMRQGITLPKPLVERTLPQLDALLADPPNSPYLAGTRNFPADVGAADRARITQAYAIFLRGDLEPAIERLRDFMRDTYLPAARTSAGLGGLPGGREWYAMRVRSATTTSMTAAQVHELGLKEVARIREEFDALRRKARFNGTLAQFMAALRDDASLRPFRSEEEVIAAYRAIDARVKAQLPRLFERTPKQALQIQPIEPIRRETASDNYMPPTLDGTRAGIFYVVVNDPKAYSRTFMTSLFLHEGQPGHHTQIALQRELPGGTFRRSVWYDAHGEGWGLYAESLGGDLGVYEDAVAYAGRLFMELHRALRLVVDTGLHDKGWTREETIAYLGRMEGSGEDSARNATERYMAWAGQALAYKIGELKIIELRERARAALGAKFDVRRYHTQVLDRGCMPLSMLEAKIDRWVAAGG